MTISKSLARPRAAVLIAAAGAFLAAELLPISAEAAAVRRIGRYCPKGQVLTEELRYRPCPPGSMQSGRPTFGGNTCAYRVKVCGQPYVVR